jgi:hypothetical protein
MQKGFVALMSVVIISAILLVLVFVLEASTFFQRYDTLDYENKAISENLAESCVQEAMLKAEQNASYAGGDCISLGGVCGGADPQKICRICSVTHSAGSATANVRAVYSGAYSNLSVTFSTTAGNPSILNWKETPSGDASCPVP